MYPFFSYQHETNQKNNICLHQIFLALRVWGGTETIQDDTIFLSGNNWEGMTIFGRNDTNPEGMTIIRKE